MNYTVTTISLMRKHMQFEGYARVKSVKTISTYFQD